MPASHIPAQCCTARERRNTRREHRRPRGRGERGLSSCRSRQTSSRSHRAATPLQEQQQKSLRYQCPWHRVATCGRARLACADVQLRMPMHITFTHHAHTHTTLTPAHEADSYKRQPTPSRHIRLTWRKRIKFSVSVPVLSANTCSISPSSSFRSDARACRATASNKSKRVSVISHAQKQCNTTCDGEGLALRLLHVG
jgi:hypothetical protein